MRERRDLSAGLVVEAVVISDRLRENGFDPAHAVNRQVLGLAEEVGEFVGAYRRWSGQARRTGTEKEMHTAHGLRVDIEAVIAAKLHIVHTRGWREQAPETCDCHRRGRARCPIHYMFAMAGMSREDSRRRVWTNRGDQR